MMTPEEDYETWKLILTTVTDDISSFATLVPDFQRLMKSIQDTGSLPEDLSSHSDDFIDFIYPNLILPLFNLGALEDEELSTVIDFFQTVVNTFTAQMSNTKELFSENLKKLFEIEESSLYTNNPKVDIRKNIINSFVSIDGFNKCLIALENENKSINHISNVTNICFSIIPFLPIEEQNDRLSELCNAICKECEKNLRSYPISSLEKMFGVIPANNQMLSLLLTLYNSEYLDKQSFSIKTLKMLVDDPKYKELMIDFLKKNLYVILSIPIHSNFADYLGTIYGFLASNGLLNMNQIQQIWSSEKFVHSTILPSFYSIFELISKQLPESESVNYAKMLIDTKSESKRMWLTMISNVAANFVNYKDKEAFNLLRDQVFYYAFNCADIDIKSHAEKELSKIASFDGQTLINKIISFEGKNYTKYELDLMDLIITHNESIDNLCNIIDIAIQYLPDSTAVSLIQSCAQAVSLSDEQKEKITKHPDRESFIQQLLFHIGLDDEEFENYFNSLPKITAQSYSTVIQYVSKYNNFSEPISFLPIQKEDILWRLALKESDVIGRFQEFLCNAYANNDGITLSDQTMIECFIDQISNRIDQSENGSIYKLIFKFIEIVEASSDLPSFNVKRHLITQSDEYIKVIFDNVAESFDLPETTEISVVLHKLSPIVNIPPNFITLSHKNAPALPNWPLHKLSIDDFIKFEFNQTEIDQKIKHLRTAIPSIVISNSHLMDILIEKAKMSTIDLNLQSLLNILPTSNKNKERVLSIKKSNSYDYEKNFQIDSPLLFIYNFAILKEYNKELEKDVLRTNGVLFLLKMVNNPHIGSNIQRILLEAIIPIDLSQYTQFTNIIFETFLRLALRSHSIPISFNSIKLITSLKCSIPPFDSTYKPVMHQKTESNAKVKSENVVNEFQSLFSEIAELVNACDIQVPSLSSFEKKEKKDSPNGYLPMDPTFESNIDESIDESVPVSHLLADILKTFICSSNKQLVNIIKEFTNQFEIPLEYFIAILPDITIDTSKAFCSSIKNQIKYKQENQIKQLISFCLTNLTTNSAIMSFSISLLYLLIEFCTPEEKDTIASFLKDNFFDVNRKFDDSTTKSAFKLLARIPSHLNECFDQIKDFLEKITSSTEYSIKLESSSSTCNKSAVGLVNLGMTCFLNATLQQFFAIPAFRKTVISYNGNDNFLIELRNLFCRMRESTSGPISPKNLAEHWINWDGTKLNVHIQQDASEFIQMLIDKVSSIMPTKMFNGTLINHIDGLTEEFHTERCEPYSILSVPISNRSTTLNDCLDAIHNVDYFTDKNQYFAETLKKKIDAKQIEYLQNLPDHLVIQLKRFELDYNTWMLKKIKQPIYFTKDIDLKSHLDPKIQNEDNTIYHLNGIVMHMGSVQGGHYFSYVRNRSTGDWYCFNDTSANLITLDDILEKANEQTSNAYLLFYDKDGLVEVDDSSIPEDLKEVISQEHQSRIFKQFFYTSSFIRFLKEILKPSNESNHDIINLAVSYSLPIILHLNYTTKCDSLISAINDRLQLSNNIPFVNSVYENLYLKGFLETDSELISKKVYKLIYKPLIKQFTIEDLPKVKSLIEFIINHFEILYDKLSTKEHVYKFIIQLLKFLQKNDKEFVQKDPMIAKLQNLIGRIFLEIIPGKVANKSRGDQESILNKINLGIIFKSYAFMPIPSAIVEKLKDPSFLLMLFLSRSIITQFIATYKRAREYFDVDSFFEHEFLPQESNHVFYLNLICAMFEVLKEKAIPLVWTVKFNVAGKIADPSKVAFGFASLCMNQITPEVYLGHLDEWLPTIFLHHQEGVRIFGPVATAFIIRHKQFESSTVKMEHESVRPVIWKEKVDDEIKSIIDKVKNILLYQCLDIAKPLIQKEFQNVDKNAFLEPEKYILRKVFDVLEILRQIEKKEKIEIFNQADNEKLHEFSLFLLNNSQVCDLHIIKMSRVIGNEYAIDFFMKILPDIQFLLNANLIILSRVDLILECVLQYCDQLPYQYIIEYFIPAYIFSSYKEFRKRSLDFLKKFILIINETDLEKAVDNNFDQNCINNIDSVLFILNAIKVKRPVLKYSINTDLSTVNLSLNDFVEYSFFSNSEIDLNDLNQIIKLLNSQKLNEKVKSIVWDYVICNCHDLEQFKMNFDFNLIYYMTNEHFMKISKLLKSFGEQEFVISYLIRISKLSIDAFIENCDFLAKTSFDIINSIEFQKSIFNQLYSYIHNYGIDINENDKFNQFLEIAFKNQSKEELLSNSINNLIDLIELYNSILEDPVDKALSKHELVDTIEPFIKLFTRYHVKIQCNELTVFIDKLKSEKVKKALDINGIDLFIELLEKYQSSI